MVQSLIKRLQHAMSASAHDVSNRANFFQVAGLARRNAAGPMPVTAVVAGMPSQVAWPELL
jgi:hypothetical protein